MPQATKKASPSNRRRWVGGSRNDCLGNLREKAARSLWASLSTLRVAARKLDLTKHWFIIGVVVVVLAAWEAPRLGVKGGPFRPEFTVRIAGVFSIFAISGFGLKPDQLREGALHWQASRALN